MKVLLLYGCGRKAEIGTNKIELAKPDQPCRVEKVGFSFNEWISAQDETPRGAGPAELVCYDVSLRR